MTTRQRPRPWQGVFRPNRNRHFHRVQLGRRRGMSDPRSLGGTKNDKFI